MTSLCRLLPSYFAEYMLGAGPYYGAASVGSARATCRCLPWSTWCKNGFCSSFAPARAFPPPARCPGHQVRLFHAARTHAWPFFITSVDVAAKVCDVGAGVRRKRRYIIVNVPYYPSAHDCDGDRRQMMNDHPPYPFAPDPLPDGNDRMGRSGD